jgi:hypothetical protein
MLTIPFITIPDKPISSASWEHLPIADIVDDVVLYKDGGAAVIMESTSLNFGLLSEREQEAVIAAYAALLNSLSFAIQIVVRSQRKDITNYMKYFDSMMLKITKPRLLHLAQSYKKFILDSIKKKNVLGKRFFIVVPFSPLELGAAKSMLTSAKGKGAALPFPKSYVVKKAKIILYPKRDHLIRQAGRVGLKFRQLTQEELIDLFYNIYNSEPPNAMKKGLQPG